MELSENYYYCNQCHESHSEIECSEKLNPFWCDSELVCPECLTTVIPYKCQECNEKKIGDSEKCLKCSELKKIIPEHLIGEILFDKKRVK